MDERQQLLNELGDVLGKMFAAGLSEMKDEPRRAVIAGLQNKRVCVSAQIAFGAGLAISFGVSDLAGAQRVQLFEIVDESRQFVVHQLEADDPVN